MLFRKGVSDPWILRNFYSFETEWTRPKGRWPSCLAHLRKPSRATSKAGEASQSTLSDMSSFWPPGEGRTRRTRNRVGSSGNVRQSASGNALPGSLRQEDFAGSLTVRSVRGNLGRIGRKRWRFADHVRYSPRLCLIKRTTGSTEYSFGNRPFLEERSRNMKKLITVEKA